jgi:hypothetical protein
MSGAIQERYDKMVEHYARLINGTDNRALIAKLQIYRSFLSEVHSRGDNLWKIEPLLHYLLSSLELDLHITLANFLDEGDLGLRKFLDFCLTNHRKILWAKGNPPSELFFSQKAKLSEHSGTINSIRGRRDKLFAHRDKLYFDDPDQAFDDFPLSEEDVIALAQCLITIVHEHEIGLHPNRSSFHVAQFFAISVDNMVRNLETGRRINFPAQKLE